ncbi:GNAT family N-acetyltransferase [Candidatus Saccharibacteria bacterium]|nr:GNAT family N-acetyltransferase [Candidatus Saccharibacteria bacterium]
MTRNDGIMVKRPLKKDFCGILDLRWRVLDEPVNNPKQSTLTLNDLNSDIVHVAAFDGDKVVSTVRLERYICKQTPTYLVRKMATDPNYQRRGIGGDVLKMAEQIIRKKGVNKLILHARPEAIKFYKSLGYKLNGRTEIHDGHQNPEMEKYLDVDRKN